MKIAGANAGSGKSDKLKRVLIFSRTYAQARECAQRHMLTANQWSFLQDRSKVYGISSDGTEVWLVGDYFCRIDVFEIENYLEARGIKPINEPDVPKKEPATCAQQ